MQTLLARKCPTVQRSTATRARVEACFSMVVRASAHKQGRWCTETLMCTSVHAYIVAIFCANDLDERPKRGTHTHAAWGGLSSQYYIFFTPPLPIVRQLSPTKNAHCFTPFPTSMPIAIQFQATPLHVASEVSHTPMPIAFHLSPMCREEEVREEQNPKRFKIGFMITIANSSCIACEPR